MQKRLRRLTHALAALTPRESQFGPVAQRLEQGTHNPLVGGSNPSGPTTPQEVPPCGSGFRLRAPASLTPVKRLKFESLRAHQVSGTILFSRCFLTLLDHFIAVAGHRCPV